MFFTFCDTHVRYILKIRIAHARPAVPFEHGVDGLGKLRRTCLIDAVGIDPYILQVVPSGLFAGPDDLLIAGLEAPIFAISPFLEGDFAVGPRVGENGVFGDIDVEEFF